MDGGRVLISLEQVQSPRALGGGATGVSGVPYAATYAIIPHIWLSLFYLYLSLIDPSHFVSHSHNATNDWILGNRQRI